MLKPFRIIVSCDLCTNINALWTNVELAAVISETVQAMHSIITER